MSGTLRISICDPNEASRENLKKFLIGMEKVWLEADCSRYEFFREIVGETTPDVASPLTVTPNAHFLWSPTLAGNTPIAASLWSVREPMDSLSFVRCEVELASS